jgi:hypothetical protein
MKSADSPAIRIRIAVAGALLLAVAAYGPAQAQDKAKAPATPAKADAKADAKDQRDRKVLVDNEKVLVTEVRYKPGSSSGSLERGNRVVRALTDGTLEKTLPDGKKETIVWKAGEVKYSPKETYSQKNIGKTELVLYSVTIK